VVWVRAMVSLLVQFSGKCLRAKSRYKRVRTDREGLSRTLETLRHQKHDDSLLYKMIRSYKGVRPTIPFTCYVDDSAQVIGDVVLGEHASVWMNTVLRGDVHSIRIGAHSNVQDCSVLHGMKEQFGVFLGEYVTVGHSVTLHGCVVEDRCLIGMGSIILNGARIGAGSIIAAGTLIPEQTVVEPGSLWMGSPGKFRRKLEERDQDSIMRYARNYLEYKEEYLTEHGWR